MSEPHRSPAPVPKAPPPGLTAARIAPGLVGSLACFAAAFFLLRDVTLPKYAAASAGGAAILFTLIFGMARRKLANPREGTEAYREAFFLGLLVVASTLAILRFVVLR